jgi:hypothetical protein
MEKSTNNHPMELKVFITSQDSTCDECSEKVEMPSKQTRLIWFLRYAPRGGFFLHPLWQLEGQFF